jgi:polyisoprenyl-phosphate glycosyltransferase
VLARRLTRGQPWVRGLGARAYFLLLNLFLGIRIDGTYGTFSVVSEKVRRAFLDIKDKDRHYLHILFWLGFETTAIDFERSERQAGRSSYSFRRLIGHAVDGIFFQTTTLLRWIVYFGFVIAFGGVLLAAGLIVYAIVATPLPGWTSLAVLILLIGGFIVISTGVTGLYVCRVFRQVKDRPIYVVDEAVGVAEERAMSLLEREA